MSNLNGENDAQKLEPDLDLRQMVEVRRRLSALPVAPGVLLQVVEEKLRHVVLLLGVHRHLVRVHPSEVLERREKLRQETERHRHRVVPGDVVETAFDELHPDEPIHVVAQETGERLLGFDRQAVGQLLDVAVLDQVPEKSVALLANAVELVVGEKTRGLALLPHGQPRGRGGQALLLAERGHGGQLLLLLQRLGQLKHVLVVGVLVLEVVQVLVCFVRQPVTEK